MFLLLGRDGSGPGPIHAAESTHTHTADINTFGNLDPMRYFHISTCFESSHLSMHSINKTCGCGKETHMCYVCVCTMCAHLMYYLDVLHICLHKLARARMWACPCVRAYMCWCTRARAPPPSTTCNRKTSKRVSACLVLSSSKAPAAGSAKDFVSSSNAKVTFWRLTL